MTKGDLFWLALFALLYRFADRHARCWLAFLIVYGGIIAVFGIHTSMIGMIVCLIVWRVIWDVAT